MKILGKHQKPEENHSKRHEGKHVVKAEIRRSKKRRAMIKVIIAELLLVAVASCGVLWTSYNHTIARREQAVSESLASFDTSKISADMGDYMKKATEAVTDMKDETVWTTAAVNYRTGPDTSYESAGVLNQYTAVNRIGTTFNEWSLVAINDQDYYIISEYLTTEPPLITDGGQKGDFERYAMSLFPDYGWLDTEIIPLVKLWNRESSWNPNAHNRSSGAHGIPQALPASKMASAGADYYTNGYTQIRWGLGYIQGRYGTPTNAWNHSQSHGWY